MSDEQRCRWGVGETQQCAHFWWILRLSFGERLSLVREDLFRSRPMLLKGDGAHCKESLSFFRGTKGNPETKCCLCLFIYLIFFPFLLFFFGGGVGDLCIGHVCAPQAFAGRTAAGLLDLVQAGSSSLSKRLEVFFGPAEPFAVAQNLYRNCTLASGTKD